MKKLIKNLNYFEYAINKIMRTNKAAKTLKDRKDVIDRPENRKLLLDLMERSEAIDTKNHTELGTNPENKYPKLLDEINNWILSGQSKDDKDYYTGSRFNDTPSEIKDNKKTSDRIYTGKRNYYTDYDYIRDEKTMPKKTIIKDNKKIIGFEDKYKNELSYPYINQIYKSLTDREAALKRNIGNRRKISKAINDDRHMLKEAMLSFHGYNHNGRSDNTISPKQSLNLPSLKNKDYIKGLLKLSLEEIHDQGMRNDKHTINDKIGTKSTILKYYERGYNESEIAQVLGTSQANISQRITRLINKLAA